MLTSIGAQVEYRKQLKSARQTPRYFHPTAATNLAIITSEIHQMFDRYHETIQTNVGEKIELDGLVGFAEEHHARC
jgi:hypothetical protein